MLSFCHSNTAAHQCCFALLPFEDLTVELGSSNVSWLQRSVCSKAESRLWQWTPMVIHIPVYWLEVCLMALFSAFLFLVFLSQHTPASPVNFFISVVLQTLMLWESSFFFFLTNPLPGQCVERRDPGFHHHFLFVFLFSYSVPWGRFNTNSSIFLSVITLGIPLEDSFDGGVGSLASLAPFSPCPVIFSGEEMFSSRQCNSS